MQNKQTTCKKEKDKNEKNIVMVNILQSQFIGKGFKKTENFEHNVVLLLSLFTLDKQQQQQQQQQQNTADLERGLTAEVSQVERFRRKPNILNICGVTVVFIYSR